MSLSANEPELFAQKFGGKSDKTAKSRDFLSEFSRGERRNAARAVAKERRLPFREVWEQAYRHRIVQPQSASIFGDVATSVLRFVVRHIVTPSGRVVHPTKGWRGKDGLPLGRKVRSA